MKSKSSTLVSPAGHYCVNIAKKWLIYAVLLNFSKKNKTPDCIKSRVLVWLRGWDLNLTTSGLWARRATICSTPRYLPFSLYMLTPNGFFVKGERGRILPRSAYLFKMCKRILLYSDNMVLYDDSGAVRSIISLSLSFSERARLAVILSEKIRIPRTVAQRRSGSTAILYLYNIITAGVFVWTAPFCVDSTETAY